MHPVDDLLAFVSAAPSPYHAVEEASRRLVAAGFTELDLAGPWDDPTDRGFVVRGGALVAWAVPAYAPAWAPFRIVGAHTDSPNLRVKPRPDTGAAGWRQVAVEVYGGALWNSWLDRDLGLSGRVAVSGRPDPLLVRVDRPLLRIPQLAIHLDRDVNGGGLKLNPQQHLTPVWGVGPVREGDFVDFLVDELPDGVDAADITGWDLMVHDLTRPARLGLHEELVASARLDNLCSCWAGIEALVQASSADGFDEGADRAAVQVVCLFDHEEVGSTSSTGADGALLAQVLERSVLSRSGDRDDLIRALAGSLCASADMAHATHPNYAERHEPGHHVAIDGGPVIKVNANQRYATDGVTAAAMVDACERADVPHQVFVGRNDVPCGSTIGPLTAARLGIATVDVGVAQLSMHSARELCGAEDPPRLAAALASFLAP
ncbi:M18 family aminopeptidase [Aquihabitans sp. G128]|uniref:M18 family aminopeptidase n=1 Tax=Aquihabitans sp. G128 TaxID=2849779 RepID=UPI001C23BCF2|nr:M18 family aminopeptidase [Aquihabitans sp. G128]QXC62123.1 M18 family aminopeptidase [Aquihabitans sp. G128]